MSERCRGENERCRFGKESEFCTHAPPGARRLIVSTSECAGSAPLMFHFLMLPKKKKKKKIFFRTFMLP